MPYLRYEAYLLRPEIIVCLGRVPARQIISPDYRITRQHGIWIRRKNCDLTAVYHPSAILRDPAKEDDARRDFEEIGRRYRELSHQLFQSENHV